MEKIGCVGLIPCTDGRFVGIQCSKGRGLILPGGKFEPDKDHSFHHAALRETLEETGILCPLGDLKYLWHGPDGFGYTTFTFLATRALGKLTSSNEGQVVIVERSDLMCSKFAPYYAVMLEILDSKYPVLPVAYDV